LQKKCFLKEKVVSDERGNDFMPFPSNNLSGWIPFSTKQLLFAMIGRMTWQF
jgi:hypothetical protein